MEILDLYNEKRELTGETMVRGEKIPKGRFKLYSVIWIKNSQNKFLVQKRSVKNRDGLLALTGGHVSSGENSKTAIIKEVKEELGINLDLNSLKFILTNKEKNHFEDVFYAEYDCNIEDFDLQLEEVDEVYWMTLEQYKEEIEKNNVIDGHVTIFNKTYDYLLERFK